MKKEKQEIATNSSSGAEKVENIEKEVKKSRSGAKTSTTKKTVKTQSVKESAKGDAALGSEEKPAKKTPSEVTRKAVKESEAAKARVEAAIKKQEEKAKKKEAKAERARKKKEAREKRHAERKALMEKRAAEKEALIEKRAAEKKALAEKRAAEKEAKLRERAHGKANKNQANARKKAEKQKRQSERKGNGERKENRSKGYGGWIAAVVSLGVVTLALATTVTVGSIDLKNKTEAAMSSYRATMYELTGVMEHVDDDLDRVRVSASPAQQSRILTDLLVQARLAELDLEKLPIPAEADRNVTTFVNRTAMECERMLAKLRSGEELSAKDYEKLERLYKTNHAVRQELDKLMTNMTDKDLMSFMKKGEGMISDTIGKLEKLTLEENRPTFKSEKGEMEGAGMKRNAPAETKDKKKIDSARAEELCKMYFSDYKIDEFQCVGEADSAQYSAYNVQGYDEKGSMLFAEISRTDGALLRFDYYEDCASETFDLQNAERIAEEFLEKIGYDDMEVVRFRNNGTTTDFTFVYEDDDVLYYPDEVRVKVCRTRGVVSGMDATRFLQNHRDRVEPKVEITLAQAYDLLHEKLTVEASKLAVVQTARGERAAYEFLCSYGGENYFVYLDALNGQEIAIVNAKTIE